MTVHAITRAKIIRLLWEKQFEGTAWEGKFHMIRPDSLEPDYGELADKIIAVILGPGRPVPPHGSGP